VTIAKEFIRTKYWRFAIAGGVVLIIFVCGLVFLRGNDLDVSNLARRVSFTISYPIQPPAEIKTDLSTMSYSPTDQGFSYIVHVDDKPVTISQQGVPDIFSEPGVYDYKLQQANEYDDFSTNFGDVTLTKPSELHGQTVAWVNAKGTLTLARVTGQSLTDNEWKLLFNNMESIN
jgi:hypothetical protein